MKAKCKKCGETVEVTKPKEYKSCKCGAIGLDYGDEYYFRVNGNPDDIDGDIEDVPKLLRTAIREDFSKTFDYISRSTKVEESFHNVNVDICEDGTAYIDDVESGEQLAVLHIKERR